MISMEILFKKIAESLCLFKYELIQKQRLRYCELE